MTPSDRPGDRPRVLFAGRWYPSYDLPVRGIFVGDLARVARDEGFDVSVASWETVVDTRPGSAQTTSSELPALWVDALRERGRPVVPASWGVPGVPVMRLPALTRIVDGHRDDAVTVARAQSQALLAWSTAAGFAPPALVHAHTGLPDGVASIDLARALGVPLVTSEHESLAVDRLADPRAKVAYARLAADGRVLLAVSDWLRRRLASALDLDPERIGVLANPVETEPFLAAAGTVARDPHQLLWVGNRRANKGTDVLLAAFARLRAERPGVTLRMIGRSPTPAEDERLRALARTLGVADSVAFDGPAPRSEIAAAMAAAGVFVHPSPIETFGVVAAEALATGLPVAASPSGGVEEIVGDDGHFGVIAADLGAEALAAAMAQALDRDGAFDRAAMAASIVERYGAEPVGARLREIYTAALGERATSTPRAGSAGTSRSSSMSRAPSGDGTSGSPALAEGDERPTYVLLALNAVGRATVDGLPDRLLQDLPVVTFREADDQPATHDGGPAWIRIDPERAFRAQRRRLGGPLPRSSGQSRLLRAIRHPRRAVSLRRLARRRAALSEVGLRADLAAAFTTVATSAGTEIVALTVDAMDLVGPLLGPRVRAWPGTLRGFVDAWDAAGRPPLGREASMWGTYDPASYWTRLHDRGDLSAVGQSARSPSFNRWLYRALESNLRRFLRKHRVLDPLPSSVFDVGVGIGYWVRLWHSLGVRRVDGCDLVESAVEGVRQAAAEAGDEGEFLVADLGQPGSVGPRTYPLVSCFNVLLHVVDDDAFDRALANVASLVAPGGMLVLAEPMLFDAAQARPYDPHHASVARPVAAYRDPLLAAGLEMVAIEHAVVLANDPLEAGSPASRARFERWWRFAQGRDRAGSRWIGPLVATVDRFAMLSGAAPTTKFALFRRPPER